MKNKRFKDWKQPWFDECGAAYDSDLTQRPYGWKCFHPEGLRLGNGCDVGSFSLLQARFGIIIGKEVEIGPFCYISSWSTIDNKQGQVIIGEGAKVGTHSTIMPGVTIGENSIIGAYSFVNKDIPANVVAYGIPCRVVKEIEGKVRALRKRNAIRNDYTNTV